MDRHMTILNVDDYEPARYARTQLLRAHGFTVIEASTGSEALQVAAAEDPALVILDVNLPDMDGFEVCRRLKQNAPAGLPPVLHVSATFTDAAARVLGLETGADGYLTEPLEPPVLIATVNALLRVKRAEAALRIAAREWQTTFDAIPDGICLVNAHGAIVRFNEAFGRVFAEFDGLIGRNVATLWSRQEIHELSRGGRWFRVTVNPLEERGRVIGAVHIVSDITRWKQLDEERAGLLRHAQAARADAERASRAKDEFLAMLGHELRNPLAPIRLAMQTIRRQAEGDPSVARARDVVDRQVTHLARLVDDLLDVARLTRQNIGLHMETAAVQQIVTEALEAVRPIIEERHHRVSVSLPEDSTWLTADSTRLVQVVANLLNNAATYTPPGGDIFVTVTVEGDEVILRVRDNGIGISADLLPQVFEMFTQGDRSLARSPGGLGIGLTIAKSIVARHGGSLTAHSEGPGKGSEFVVRLPLTIDGRMPGASAGAESAAACEPRRVLVVEDNEDTLEMLRLTLELEGNHVEATRDGGRAVDLALEGSVDVVVIDIGLPGIDGYEVARRIRASRGDEVYLIALTGYGRPDDFRRSREAGFDAHLIKPVETEELARVVSSRPLRS
jgi:signal transduction histidine kinase